LAIALTTLSAVLPGSATAQAGASWQVSARLRGMLQYDDNPFLLDTAQVRKLGQPSAADSISGRFRDMLDARDLIPIPSLELGASGAGLMGRRLAFEADVAYEPNIRNLRRQHTELGFSIEQALSRADRVRFTVDWVPSYFVKNYLATVSETDGDRLVTSDERRYAPGVYRETAFGLEYRHRFVRANHGRPFGLSAGVRGGYGSRSYDAPFNGRDRKGPEVEGSLALDLGSLWTLGFDYTYNQLEADPSREVQILDETLYGVDFNANGTTTDLDALALELVDQSRRDHEVGVSLEGKLSDAVSVRARYARRTRTFTSTQPFDAAHLDRQDHRDAAGARIDIRLATSLELTLAGEMTTQTTNRAGDPGSTGEEAAYRRHVATAAFRWRF